MKSKDKFNAMLVAEVLRWKARECNCNTIMMTFGWFRSAYCCITEHYL